MTENEREEIIKELLRKRPDFKPLVEFLASAEVKVKISGGDTLSEEEVGEIVKKEIEDGVLTEEIEEEIGREINAHVLIEEVVSCIAETKWREEDPTVVSALLIVRVWKEFTMPDIETTLYLSPQKENLHQRNISAPYHQVGERL